MDSGAPRRRLPGERGAPGNPRPLEGSGRRGGLNARPPGPGLAGAARFVSGASSGGILRFFTELSERYGPVSSFPLGPQRIVLVDDPVLIETILVARQHEFVRDTGATLLRELVGDGLLTSEDPAHLARRRLMQPAFHRNRIAGYAEAVVTETDRMTAAWDAAPRIDLGPEMAAVTLAAVGRALFGGDLRDEARAISCVLAGVVRRGGSLGALLALAAPMLGPLHRLFPKRASLLFPRERAELERIVAPLIAARRADVGSDLLSLLLAARDEGGGGLDDEAIRNEVVMLILAGHETTANALTWTWYLLAGHPGAERRLHAELDAVLDGRPPAFADLPNLRYTAQVFDETLRLYPPASAFARRPLHALELGGFAIPKMASVFVSPFVTQRNPRNFAEPLTFAPERWAGPTPAKFAYFPFGGGSKMCIGEPFARMEAVLVIARVASRYRLRRVDSAPVEPSAQALLRPARPIEMEAVPR